MFKKRDFNLPQSLIDDVSKIVESSEKQLDEISDKTLNSYQAKAARSFSKDRFSSDKKVAAKAVKHGEGATKAVKRMAKNADISKDDRGYGKGRYMGDSVEITDKLVEEVKPGDHVHVGMSQKGGIGFRGVVTKTDGDHVYFRDHEKSKFGYRQFKGLLKHTSVEKSVNEASGTMNAQVAPADQSKPIDVTIVRKKKVNEDFGGAGSASDGDVDDLDDYMDEDYNDFDPLEDSNDVEEPLGEDVDVEEMIQEVLSKDATAGDWIHDFVHSKNPKFEGKSKKERQKMALAAYYAKQRNEEKTPEQKRKDDLWAAAKKKVEGGGKVDKPSSDERAGKARAGEYAWGTRKEEVESLDELKKTTVSSYLKKKLDKFDKDKENFTNHQKDQENLTRATKRVLRKSPVSEGTLKNLKRIVTGKTASARFHQELGKAADAAVKPISPESNAEHKKHSNRMMKFHSLMKKEDKDPHMDAGCGTVQPFVQNENPTSNPILKKMKKK